MERTENVGNGTVTLGYGEIALKPPKGKPREYLFVQNVSANDVYLNRGTHADINHGITLGPGQFYERTAIQKVGIGQYNGVPQETIYVSGSQVGPQQINVDED